MQFLVIAHDGTDSEAPQRRLAARTAHLEGIGILRAQRKVIEGGALLNDNGDMIGSALIVDFPTESEMHDWLANDPYTIGKVWQHVEVKRFRSAPH